MYFSLIYTLFFDPFLTHYHGFNKKATNVIFNFEEEELSFKLLTKRFECLNLDIFLAQVFGPIAKNDTFVISLKHVVPHFIIKMHTTLHFYNLM